MGGEKGGLVRVRAVGEERGEERWKAIGEKRGGERWNDTRGRERHANASEEREGRGQAMGEERERCGEERG